MMFAFLSWLTAVCLGLALLLIGAALLWVGGQLVLTSLLGVTYQGPPAA